MINPLAQAYLLFQKGFTAEAESVCRDLLASDPADPEALHLLGVIEAQKNNPVAALEFVERAIALNPHVDRFHLSRSVVLQQLNRPDEALASADLALKLRPAYPRALNSRGAILYKLGRFDDALASYNRALSIDAKNADALVNRGVLLHECGQLNEAISDYDRAIALTPANAEAFNNRGLALQRLSRFAEALDSFEHAIRCKPDYAEARNNRGLILQKTGRFAEAIESYEKALAIAPNFVEALNNLGVCLHRLNRFEDALAVYDRALAADPNASEALCNRGQVLMVQGETREAIESLRRAASAGNNSAVHSAFIFGLNFDPSATAAIKQSERSLWAKRYAVPLEQSIAFHANQPDPDRRLRIGYVSSYFRSHAAGMTAGGVITQHDRDGFEIVCYSDTVVEDDVTRGIRERADFWRDTFGVPDAELANMIRQDGIDILVDTVGHMAGNRLLAFARKPAPVQVTAWGEPTGTGLPAMDYLFADERLVPQCEKPLLSEQIVALPNFLGYWMPEGIPPPNDLPALRNGYVTFGSFNRLEKLSAESLSVWAQLLNRMATARLVLKDRALANAAQKKRIETFFLRNGIEARRVKLLAETGRAEHFAMYQEIDIALDPFPHSGGMTTLDALWMGVPVITAPGQTISSRLAAASLSALGLDSFIAHDLNGYVGLVLEKARNLQALSQLRPELRGMLAASEFGDPARYSRAVEAAYRDAWRHWCAAKSRQSGSSSPGGLIPSNMPAASNAIHSSE